MHVKSRTQTEIYNNGELKIVSNTKGLQLLNFKVKMSRIELRSQPIYPFNIQHPHQKQNLSTAKYNIGVSLQNHTSVESYSDAVKYDTL